MSDYEDDIRKYKEGSLTNQERNALEKKALSDPFLADALEGSELVDAEDFSKDVQALKEGIIAKKKVAWFTPLRVAAGVLIAAVAATLYYYSSPELPHPVAENKVTSSGPSDSGAKSPVDSAAKLLTLAKPDEPKNRQGSAAGTETRKPAAARVAADQGTAKAAGEPVKIAEAEDVAARADKKEEVVLDEKEKVKEAPVVQPTVSETHQPIAPARSAEGSLSKRAMPSRVDDRSSGLSSNTKTVSGTVIAVEDGKPIPGVNVLVKGTNSGTVTDLRGRYSIQLPASNSRLSYSFIGLETYEITPGDNSEVDVQLREDVSQLSEVVVRGQRTGEAKDDLSAPVVRLAFPAGGIKAYNKYLENNLHYPASAREKNIKGKVAIEFTVTTSGELTDFNVVRSLGYGCDEEVIRLVKDGPQWSPSLENDVPVESEVRVKLKFDPDKNR